MKAINLKTEHLRNPLGIDVKAPVLSWNDSEGIRQTAYQVVALQGTRSAKGNLEHGQGVKRQDAGHIWRVGKQQE